MPLREQAAGQISSISWNEPHIHFWAKKTLSYTFSRKNSVLSHFKSARWRIQMGNSMSVGKVVFHKTLPCLAIHCFVQFIEWNREAAGFKQRMWKSFLPTPVDLNRGRVCPGMRWRKASEEKTLPVPTSAPLWCSLPAVIFSSLTFDGYKKSSISLPRFPQDPTAANPEKPWTSWIKDLPVFNLLDLVRASNFSFLSCESQSKNWRLQVEITLLKSALISDRGKADAVLCTSDCTAFEL